MEAKAREGFLLKVYNQGFLIEESGRDLILRPRGYAEPAEVTITETLLGDWNVTGASGAYSRYYRDKKHRAWFEGLVNGLASLSVQELL